MPDWSCPGRSSVLHGGKPYHAAQEDLSSPWQVVLSFYEARRKQPWALGFGAQEERLFWEQWCGSNLIFALYIQPEAQSTVVAAGDIVTAAV